MKAIIAGTFDPFTLGHFDITACALGIFGEVIVAVAEDTGKVTASLSDRTELARRSVEGLAGVTVEPFGGLLTDFAKSRGGVIVRGLRNSRDYEYERDLCATYRALGEVDTVFLPCSAQFEHISSTAARTLARLGAPLDGFVRGEIIEDVRRIYGNVSNKE